jgi:hypothetical protein
LPTRESFWLRSTADGHLAWSPGDVTGGPYSLVIMSPGAKPGIQLSSSAELRPSWLNSSTWGLLTLGTLLAMIGLITLAWPARRREVVYVVEPSQVPGLMAAIGAPLPPANAPAARHGGAHRPRTLADAQKAALPAAPNLTWPPTATPALTSPATVPTASAPAPVSAAAWPGTPETTAARSGASPTAAFDPGGPEAVAVRPGGGSAVAFGSGGSSTAALGSDGTSAVAFGSGDLEAAAAPAGWSGAADAPASRSGPPSAAEYAAATAIPGRPAPGEPLSFIKPTTGGGIPLGDYPDSADPLFGRRGERVARKREPGPGDLPLFQASAVGAWVAETAAERARATEATAAARMAEVARKKAAAAAGATAVAGEGAATAAGESAGSGRGIEAGGGNVDGTSLTAGSSR